MEYKRVVVKLGTSTITGGGNSVNQSRLLDIVKQLAGLVESGFQVCLVTSGAIAAGKEALGYPDFPKHIPSKQMLASIGQPRLMEVYSQLFRIYKRVVAQVLLTRTDLGLRRGYINARNTLEAMLSQGIIPIINENDAVATEEIRVGDNDNLSALVANLIEADLLILLTDLDGLYTSDPRQNKEAKLIKEVKTKEIPASIWESAGGSVSGLGTGGMYTKIKAADMARRSGTTVVIASGSEKDGITRIVAGEALGTRFLPVVSAVESRKRYMLAGLKTSRGVISIDDGAVRALQMGNSLLPVGVVAVTSTFERGDPARIISPDGKEIAIGLCNYSSDDIARLCKQRSDDIENILGYTFGDEIVHRSNLVILAEALEH